MKRLSTILPLVPLFIVGMVVVPSFGHSAPTAYSTIQNASTLNGKYTFDVWGNSSDRSVNLSEIQWAFGLNSNALDTNSVVVTLVPKYAAFVITWHAYTNATKLVINLKLPAGTPAIHLTDLTPGEKVCSVTMNIKQFSATANLSWRQPGDLKDYPLPCLNGGFVGYTWNIFQSGDNIALPIQLASFKAVALAGGGVTLKWTTVGETNNYGFYVQRNGVDLTFIAGHGTTLDQHSYSFSDSPVPGQFKYGLKQVDLDGTATLSETILMDVATIAKFALNQNYPNPFNPSTQIAFSISKEGPTSLRMYDVLGSEVATLVNENRKAGEYTERFDGSRLASGVYMYVLRSSEGQLVGRMILSK